jgi:hypothetical protein
MGNLEIYLGEQNMHFQNFQDKWRREFYQYLSEHQGPTERFLKDQEFGLRHSFNVLIRSLQLADKIARRDKKPLRSEVVEYIAVFHDIGKFFQDLHTVENVSYAAGVFEIYAGNKGISPEITSIVLDGIINSDFYNKRLDPSLNPPKSIEGEVVRAADKMLDNIVGKVDRYYNYGVARGKVFFDPTLTFEERKMFSFNNFVGDQLNVILSILGLTPEDFSHPVLQEEYRRWSLVQKKRVVARIVSLAEEIGESEENIKKIKHVIRWYRETFRC